MGVAPRDNTKWSALGEFCDLRTLGIVRFYDILRWSGSRNAMAPP